jgi:hypothetical protein
MDYVIGTCLQKSPDDRYQSAHDIVLELKRISEVPKQRPVQTKSVSKLWIAAALFLGMVVGGLALYFLFPKPPAQVVALSILPPSGITFNFSGLYCTWQALKQKMENLSQAIRASCSTFRFMPHGLSMTLAAMATFICFVTLDGKASRWPRCLTGDRQDNETFNDKAIWKKTFSLPAKFREFLSVLVSVCERD